MISQEYINETARIGRKINSDSSPARHISGKQQKNESKTNIDASKVKALITKQAPFWEYLKGLASGNRPPRGKCHRLGKYLELPL